MKPLFAMLLMAFCLLFRLGIAISQDIIREQYWLVSLDIVSLIACVCIFYGVLDTMSKVWDQFQRQRRW